jgi:hypothetical protein
MAEEESKQAEANTKEVLSLPDAEPSVAQRTGAFLGGVTQSARNAFKKASKMIAKDEIIVLGERVVLKEEGFVPEKFNDRVSFQQKYFYTLQSDLDLNKKRAIFEKYFNEASQMSADNPRPPCDLAEKQTLLEGLMNRFNTLRTEIRILSKQTPDSVDLRQRIDHAMRLKSFMEMLDSQPDCLSYDDKGRVSIINGDPTIKDEDLELLLRRFAVLVLQAKNPLTTDTKVNQDFARQLVAKVQELGTLDDTGVKAYIGDRKASATNQNLRTPEKFQQLIEGDPLVKAGSTKKELLELRDALWGKLEGIHDWDTKRGELEAIFKDEAEKSEEKRLKEQIAGSVAWIIEKYTECFKAIDENRRLVAEKDEEIRGKATEIESLKAQAAAAKAAAASGTASAGARLAEAEQKLAEATAANEALRAEKAGLEARASELRAQGERLQAAVDTKEGELAAEKAKVARIEADLRTATEARDRAAAALAAAQAAPKAVDTADPAKLIEEIGRLRGNLAAASVTARLIKTQHEDAKHKLAEKEAELARKEGENRVSIDRLQQQLADIRAQLAGKEAESAALKQSSEERQARIDELEGRLREFQGTAAQKAALEAEVEGLRQQMRQAQAAEAERNRLRDQIAELQRRLAEAGAAGGNNIPLEGIQRQIEAIKAALNAEGGPPAAALPALEGGPLAGLYAAIQGFAMKQKASIDSAKGYQLCYLNFIVTYFLKRFLKEEGARTAVQSLERALNGILNSFRDINGRKIFGDQETISADGYKEILDSIFPLLETTESLYLNGYLGPSSEPVGEGYYIINQYDLYAADRSKQEEARGRQTQLNDIIYKLYKFVKEDSIRFGSGFEAALKPSFKTSKTHVGFRPPFLPPREASSQTYEYPYDKQDISIEHRNWFTRPIVIYIKADKIQDMNVYANFSNQYGKWDIPHNQFQSGIEIQGEYQELVRTKALNIKQTIPASGDKREQPQRPLLSYEFLFTFFLLVARRYLKAKGEDLQQQGCPLPRLLNGEMRDRDAEQYGKDVEGGLPAAGASIMPLGGPIGAAGPAVALAGRGHPPPPPALPLPPPPPPAAPAEPATPPIAALTGRGDASDASDADIKRRICLILRQISRASAISLTPEMKEDLDTFQYKGQSGSKLFEKQDSVIRKFNMKWSTQPTMRISFPSTVDQSTTTKEPFVQVGNPCDADVTTFLSEYLKQFIPKTPALQSDYTVESSKAIIKRLREFFQDMFVTYYYTYPIKNPDETNTEAKYEFLKNAFNNSLNIPITKNMIDNNTQFLGHRDTRENKKVYHFKITSTPDTLAKYVAIGIPAGGSDPNNVALTPGKLEGAKTNLLR